MLKKEETMRQDVSAVTGIVYMFCLATIVGNFILFGKSGIITQQTTKVKSKSNFYEFK